MSHSLAQLLLTPREFMTWCLLQLNKVLEPFPSHDIPIQIQITFLLAILYNMYLLAKLLKHQDGMQLVICLQLINT